MSWHSCRKTPAGSFRDSTSFLSAGLTDFASYDSAFSLSEALEIYAFTLISELVGLA